MGLNWFKWILTTLTLAYTLRHWFAWLACLIVLIYIGPLWIPGVYLSATAGLILYYILKGDLE